jgi:L-alanine-DL-glutamate epimerase-like enolase superfamily enzyme
MTITSITTRPLRLPLKRPFVTALRSVSALENVLVSVYTDTGPIGYGEAAAATQVTGETAESIQAAIHTHIKPTLTGQPADDWFGLTRLVQQALPYNPSAKAAVEAALFNLQRTPTEASARFTLPKNNLTISAGEPKQMAADALQAVDEGFRQFKIKLGKHPDTDAHTLLSIWRALCEQRPGAAFGLRVDANGGWSPKQALRILQIWEDKQLPIRWVEQPTPRHDIKGLAQVTRNTHLPIVADESVFTPQDAVRVLESRAADWINIKLAKSGGITPCADIAAVCRAYGVPWLMGCMLESRLATSAAAVCAAMLDADAIDLDGAFLCAKDPFTGGVLFNGEDVHFTGEPIGLPGDAT